MADNLPDKFVELLEREKPSILERIPKLNDWMTPERWWAVNYELLKNEKLQKVAVSNPLSLINALKKLAEWGLEADGDEAFINVYGNEAVPQAMYKGLIRRAVEAGIIAHAVADVIKEGDVIEIESGTDGRKIRHRPAFGKDGGKRAIIGAYALFTMPNGLTDYELMEASDLEAVKAAALRMAQRYDKNATLSPAWRFFEGQMSKKSVLRRGLQRMKGKRPDTIAGKSFSDMLADMKRADDPEPPDDLPKATDGTEAPTPRKVKAELVPDKPKEDRLLSTEEQNDAHDAWSGLGGKGTALKSFLKKHYERDDLEEIKLSELDGLMAKMQQELIA